jgi:hypothetical protein
VNPYEHLQAAVAALAAEFPTVSVGTRSLRGTRDVGDHLILERAVGDSVRVVRISASADAVRGFYWGHLPLAGKPQLAAHGEGNRYGNLAYVLSFVRAFLFELQDWRMIPNPRVDGSPQSG